MIVFVNVSFNLINLFLNLGYKILGVFKIFSFLLDLSYCWFFVIFGLLLIIVIFLFVRWFIRVDLFVFGILIIIVWSVFFWILCFCSLVILLDINILVMLVIFLIVDCFLELIVNVFKFWDL